MAGNTKIIIVEDDPLVAMDLKETLSKFGYKVIGSFDSGEELLENIDTLSPDVLLMDIKLKGKLDGIQTASKISAPSTFPIIFLTALNDESTLQRAKLTRPYAYLIKPFDPAELHSAIELSLYRFGLEGGVEKEHSFQVSKEEEEVFTGASSDRAEFLSTIPALEGVSSQTLKALVEHSEVREFDGGDFITLEGQEESVAFIPMSGRLSIMKTSEAGRELIVALLAPRDIFGCFLVMPAFQGNIYARAQIPSRVLWIQADVVRHALQVDPTFSYKMNEAFAERLLLSHKLASSLAHLKVESRIINTLLALLPTFGRSSGKSVKGGPGGERIYITRKELAELTGTTPETAIRVTKSLEREGILDLSRPGIIKILDVANLSDYHQRGREREREKERVVE